VRRSAAGCFLNVWQLLICKNWFADDRGVDGSLISPKIPFRAKQSILLDDIQRQSAFWYMHRMADHGNGSRKRVSSAYMGECFTK
jgi:hypothetical protein